LCHINEAILPRIMSKVVVTSYTEPDLDGYACSVAYSEFLNKTGTPAVTRIFGTPHIEARYLLERFRFSFEEDNNAPLERVVLVDASELRDLDAFVRPEDVVEIIDHRRFNDADLFKNAKIQIELVGSAATLITEKFYERGVDISVPAATMLYGAIVSNTLNFRAKVTSDRDRKMADWLNQKLELGKGFIEEMFRAKSNMKGSYLEQAVDADFAWFDFGAGSKIGYAQLEMMDARQLVNTRKDELLTVLNELKEKEGVDRIFLSLIDLGEGFNIFVTDDQKMQKTLTNVLGITFENNVAIRSGFIMRKEVTPLLKEYFSN
jgi:manganese-dependent inorganic pyrophosphatase